MGMQASNIKQQLTLVMLFTIHGFGSALPRRPFFLWHPSMLLSLVSPGIIRGSRYHWQRTPLLHSSEFLLVACCCTIWHGLFNDCCLYQQVLLTHVEGHKGEDEG